MTDKTMEAAASAPPAALCAQFVLIPHNWMMKMITPMRLLTSTLLAAFTLAGCTSFREEFPGQDVPQLWTALVAVAETPDYSDDDPDKRWIVQENDVWVDEENARIEVYRKVHRLLHRARTEPLLENRTWRFQVVMEQSDPPTAEFVSRGFAVPTHATMEAERFFEDVWSILGGPPVEMDETSDEVAAAAMTDDDHDDLEEQLSDERRPLVDVEALEPK